MPRGKSTPPETRNAIIRLYAAIGNMAAVAEATGIHRATIGIVLRKAGFVTRRTRRRPQQKPTKPVQWTRRPNKDDIDNTIRTEYPTTGPQPIATRFGLTTSIVSKRAWQLGIRCLTHMTRKNSTVAKANATCDQAFFENWSPNLAWLLGYTWADGTISYKKGENRITYRCAVTDEHIIHDIMQAARSTAPVERFPAQTLRNGYTGQPQVGFRISSISVVRLLVERYGIPPNKSNTDPPMPNIPDEWLAHFARGVIDGDGSICGTGSGDRLQVVIYGSHQFVEAIRHRIAVGCGVRLPNRNTTHTSDKLSRISWSSAADVRQLIDWLYPPGTYLALDRKRRAAEAYLKSNSPQTPAVQTEPTADEWSDPPATPLPQSRNSDC